MTNIFNLLKITKPFVLASKSPRRRKLLLQIGFDFEVIPADIDENEISNNLPPDEYAKVLSRRKAIAVASELRKDAIILGADTIVVLNGQIINKPLDEEDAYNLLSSLSGNTHQVYTGITLTTTELNRTITKVQKTEVTFRELTEEEIRAYIKTGSPLDKAGAYGIQDDFGAVFVSQINGCYSNVVGLPLELLYTTMKEFGE